MATKNGTYRVTAKLSKKIDAGLIKWFSKRTDKSEVIRRGISAIKHIESRQKGVVVIEVTDKKLRPLEGVEVQLYARTTNGKTMLAPNHIYNQYTTPFILRGPVTDEDGRVYFEVPKTKRPLSIEIPRQVALGNSRTELCPIEPSDVDDSESGGGMVDIAASASKIHLIRIPVYVVGPAGRRMRRDNGNTLRPNKATLLRIQKRCERELKKSDIEPGLRLMHERVVRSIEYRLKEKA